MSQNPIARKEGLVLQEMPDELLVYDLETNKAHCLNETSALIWKACDGDKSVSEITVSLGNSVPEELVWLAIDQLNEKNLLENKVPTKFSGQTRREVIKKIGLASVIALPFVASLVAPTSVLAVVSCGQPCTCVSPCVRGGTGDPCASNSNCPVCGSASNTCGNTI